MKTLDGGRIGIAAQALGIAQGALDASLAYSKERKQFDTPIAAFQGVQFQLADMATQVEAARLVVYNAAYRASHGLGYSKESAMAKLFASETAMKVTTQAVQIHGGYGYYYNGYTHFFNASVLNERYSYANLPFHFEWDSITNEIKWL